MKKLSSYQKLNEKNEKLNQMIYQLVMEPKKDTTLALKLALTYGYNVEIETMYGSGAENNSPQGIKNIMSSNKK